MKIIGVIPARWASTRFPGKSLKLVLGKSLIRHVIEGAQQSQSLSELIVATDHPDIARESESAGAQVVMTDSNLPSGSDRVWAAVRYKKFDAVINIQGDEPLITAEPLDSLSAVFRDSQVQIATLAREFTQTEDFLSPNTAKVVLDQNSNALYFSRLPIPHTRGDYSSGWACYKHVGLYGYRKEFLKAFCEQPPVPLEVAEGLEQLRALWLGAKIRVILTEFESWGVDTPEDVVKVEKILRRKDGK